MKIIPCFYVFKKNRLNYCGMCIEEGNKKFCYGILYFIYIIIRKIK